MPLIFSNHYRLATNHFPPPWLEIGVAVGSGIFFVGLFLARPIVSGKDMPELSESQRGYASRSRGQAVP
jgi:hypothetical protein